MSSIYITEPATSGKVLLHTSEGDIDVELWSKECPLACRNFIQLCMEGYYNGTCFHRVIKDFMVQGGDPTGTGQGGESTYGKPFRDEFHARLKFSHRGILAMANAGTPDDNGSQFFLTLGECRWLDKKHTIFGKITGNTIFNLLNIGKQDTNPEDRPYYPTTITSVEILSNPFEDIEPRAGPGSAAAAAAQEAAAQEEERKKKPRKKLKKNSNLLSFGEEAEAEERDLEGARASAGGGGGGSGKGGGGGGGKSSHDLLDAPELSKEPAARAPGTETTGAGAGGSGGGGEDSTNAGGGMGGVAGLKSAIARGGGKDKGDGATDDADDALSFGEKQRRRVREKEAMVRKKRAEAREAAEQGGGGGDDAEEDKAGANGAGDEDEDKDASGAAKKERKKKRKEEKKKKKEDKKARKDKVDEYRKLKAEMRAAARPVDVETGEQPAACQDGTEDLVSAVEQRRRKYV